MRLLAARTDGPRNKNQLLQILDPTPILDLSTMILLLKWLHWLWVKTNLLQTMKMKPDHECSVTQRRGLWLGLPCRLVCPTMITWWRLEMLLDTFHTRFQCRLVRFPRRNRDKQEQKRSKVNYYTGFKIQSIKGKTSSSVQLRNFIWFDVKSLLSKEGWQYISRTLYLLRIDIANHISTANPVCLVRSD